MDNRALNQAHFQKNYSEMNDYERFEYYQKKVNSLLCDIRLTASMTEEEAQVYFNADSKEEIIAILNEELEGVKQCCDECLPVESDIWDSHGFRDEADYIRYRYS